MHCRFMRVDTQGNASYIDPIGLEEGDERYQQAKGQDDTLFVALFDAGSRSTLLYHCKAAEEEGGDINLLEITLRKSIATFVGD